MKSNELQHDWTAKPKRLRGTLSIRPSKPDATANDDHQREREQ